jgi:uncharacterized membrane protein (UPF0182 family)
MPEGLRRHLRYPELALLARSEILQEYHLERVEAFYAGQNVWQRPQQGRPAAGPGRTVRYGALMPVPWRRVWSTWAPCPTSPAADRT